MSAQGQTDALQQAEKMKYLIFFFYRLQVNSDFMGHLLRQLSYLQQDMLYVGPRSKICLTTS